MIIIIILSHKPFIELVTTTPIVRSYLSFLTRAILKLRLMIRCQIK